MKKCMSQFLKTILMLAVIFMANTNHILGQSNIKYDIILEGGRVIDPETKLDAIRNIGIKNGSLSKDGVFCNEIISQHNKESLNGIY